MFETASIKSRISLAVITSAFMYLPGSICFAQGFHEAPSLAPIELPSAPVLPSLYPTDVTHVGIGQQQELLRPGFSYYLFQKLPSNLWFNITAEESQRFESNVFFTKTHPRRDYVFRSMPNISLGYETWKGINVYCNYFVIKDIFLAHKQLTFPTTQSLSLGVRRDFTINQRTTFQLDFQSRELWQSTRLRQFDFLPGMTLTRFMTPHTVLFFNTILQLRGGQPFVAPTREIDPFYTLGLVYTKGQWMFSNVGTLVTNFRHPPFNDAVPPQSNNSIIYDFEISHPVPKMPFLVSFVRAEPIWNWNSKGVPGISGFDFRLFGGLRLTIAKPAYHSSIETLKQQLKEFNLGPAGSPPMAPMQNPLPMPSTPTPTETPSSQPNPEKPEEKPEKQTKPPVEPQYSPSEGPVSHLFTMPTYNLFRLSSGDQHIHLDNDMPASYLNNDMPISDMNLRVAAGHNRVCENKKLATPWTELQTASSPLVSMPTITSFAVSSAYEYIYIEKDMAISYLNKDMPISWMNLAVTAGHPASAHKELAPTWTELQTASGPIYVATDKELSIDWADIQIASSPSLDAEAQDIPMAWTEFQTAAVSSPRDNNKLLLSGESPLSQ